MAWAVNVVFSPGGKVYSFDPNGLELAWDERVICNTSRGPELARIVTGNHEVERSPKDPPLRPIDRRATSEDEVRVKENKAVGRKAMLAFRDLLRERGIENARPVGAEVSFDGSRIALTYRAEERSELRSVAGPLSSRLGTRVEVRQVSPREAARQCGGGGMCGPVRCCTRFPSHEQPITLRMAKDQDVPMNPGRITGLCGRLRCCLAFEHPVYRSFRDRAPAVGRMVKTPQGRGIVRSYKVLDDTLVVALEGVQGEVDIRVDDASEITSQAR
jgi:cell fate regulator YaaT (PSP1 superfamily)